MQKAVIMSVDIIVDTSLTRPCVIPEGCVHSPDSMVVRRVFLALGGIWELARYAFIYLLVAGSFNAAMGDNYNPVFLWLGSGQLVVAAAFLYVAFYPGRITAYRPLLLIAKGIGIVTELLLILANEAVMTRVGRFFAIGPGVVPDYAELAGAGVFAIAILVLDLIFFMFLVSYREDRRSHYHPLPEKTENLPEFSDRTIEEE